MDADIKNAILKLRERARWLMDQADQLERAAPLLSGKTNSLSHNTAEGRARIAEANKNLWTVCPLPECRGVKHRRTHPHILASTKASAETVALQAEIARLKAAAGKKRKRWG